MHDTKFELIAYTYIGDVRSQTNVLPDSFRCSVPITEAQGKKMVLLLYISFVIFSFVFVSQFRSNIPPCQHQYRNFLLKAGLEANNPVAMVTT